MKSGIVERFGADVFAKLEKHNQLEQYGINPAGVKFKWLLTKRVRLQHICLALDCIVCSNACHANFELSQTHNLKGEQRKTPLKADSNHFFTQSM